MGWFSGSGKDVDAKSTTGDPFRDLDPNLRDFLEKESPVKYKASPAPAPAPSQQIPTSDQPETSSTSSQSTKNPPVAPPSLYPDGRYKDLWSTYTPLSTIENASKTDQEKLMDILNGYKSRKAQIGRAALENCADEQWAVTDCFKNGGVKSRMTMCRTENRSLERCYVMQNRFLKALGYLSMYDRPSDVDERIQMHADTLYHRMLDQERQVEEAKAAGLPVPVFQPILAQPRSDKQPESNSEPSPVNAAPESSLSEFLQNYPPKVRESVKQRFKGLSPEETAIEIKAVKMELDATVGTARELDKYMEEQAKAKRERKERGKETFGDRISSIFGW